MFTLLIGVLILISEPSFRFPTAPVFSSGRRLGFRRFHCLLIWSWISAQWRHFLSPLFFRYFPLASIDSLLCFFFARRGVRLLLHPVRDSVVFLLSFSDPDFRFSIWLYRSRYCFSADLPQSPVVSLLVYSRFWQSAVLS